VGAHAVRAGERLGRMTIEFDGRPVTADDLCALALYNYGHFTSMKVEEGLRVRGLSLHIERLARDCKILFDTDVDHQRVRHLVRRVADVSPLPVIVRVTVFDPRLELGHPGSNAEPHILVSTRPASTNVAAPPLRLKSMRYERDLPAVKHVGLFATLYHRRAAQLSSFDDVLFTDSSSQISEGATWNIGFVHSNQVEPTRAEYTLWPQSDVLPGVTMQLVKNVLSDMGVRSTTGVVTISQVAGMRAAFVTNASVGVRPVRSIDNVDFSMDVPLLAAMQRNYLSSRGEPL